MADPPAAKKRNLFQKIAALVKAFEEWTAETFADAELTELKADLGLDPTNPATPTPDTTHKGKIDAFVAKQAEDIDEAALLEVVESIKETAESVITFIDAVKKDNVDPWTIFWILFKVWAVDAMRVRNPSAYALVRIAGFVTQDEEVVQQLDAAALTKLVRGEGSAADGEALVQRLSMLGGVTAVMIANLVDKIDGVVDTLYGWDPDPTDDRESAVIASRALTVVLTAKALGGFHPAFTLIGVPKGHTGPGMLVAATAGMSLPVDVGNTTYTTAIAGAAAFSLFVPFKKADVRAFGASEPSIRITAEPKKGLDVAGAPALIVGTAKATRLEIGAFALGVEIAGDHTAFRLGVRKGKLVVALGKGDGFLRQLPGGNIEAPFELGLIADTRNGVRFEGGTGLRVNLPVSASLFGVFTVQFLELELLLQNQTKLDLRGGFSLKLGPFGASIDRAGMTLDLQKLSKGFDSLAGLVSFAPPKGIGLVLDIAGVVKGGGYLFIDAERGEYAGALELKFMTWSIKALGLLSTKRPDGSEGWSLLLFVFGQFTVPIGNTGIFWTGLGGMIGLHHRSDADALTAGMKTGALDDILFPENPIADAPRIITRYRTLFPIEPNNLIVGPMLELSLLQPPVVYIRLGLIFDVRNALGGSAPTALSKVILLGQILAQMPPKATGAPAVLKLLVDVVGFYDADTQFLLIRARLRDSFAGVEHIGKINLSGELLIAVDFAASGNFVISAGGFHPKYQGLPARVPSQLDRLQASFGLGPVKLSVQMYFALTPNSIQAGAKISLSANFSIASIEASLSFDALLYLSPRFYFVIDLEFRAKVKAFGRTLASVGVSATLEGPDQWHIHGEFSFSILWWDKTVGFDERWGEVEQADPGTASLAQALMPALSNPDNLTPEAPAGGSMVTLAPPKPGEKLAHPLGRLAVRQKVVPFGLRIDRLGTKRLAGGPTSVSVQSVLLNDQPLPGFDSTSEPFARGQFVELSDAEKLTGKVLETFPSGVVVGRSEFTAPAATLARDVTANFETVRLDPQPKGVILKWTTVKVGTMTTSYTSAYAASKLGAAARSERAERLQRRASPLAAAAVTVQDPPLAIVDPLTLKESATLVGAAKQSASLAAQQAKAGGAHLVEAFELVR